MVSHVVSLLPSRPSLTNDGISKTDAHVLFEAVRQGHLPMIRRRLSGGERAQLRSGDVFVWEEAAHKGGLERWTDGRKWYVHLHIIPSVGQNLLGTFTFCLPR